MVGPDDFVDDEVHASGVGGNSSTVTPGFTRDPTVTLAQYELLQEMCASYERKYKIYRKAVNQHYDNQDDNQLYIATGFMEKPTAEPTPSTDRPMTVKEAAERSVCRICGRKAWPAMDELHPSKRNYLELNFGDEFAHTRCLLHDLHTRLKKAEEERDLAKAKADKLMSAVVMHHSQRADDRCIEDDDAIYAAADLAPCDRKVGDKFEMLKNCSRYIDRRTESGGWPTYKQLEEALAKAKSALLYIGLYSNDRAYALTTEMLDRIREIERLRM